MLQAATLFVHRADAKARFVTHSPFPHPPLQHRSQLTCDHCKNLQQTLPTSSLRLSKYAFNEAKVFNVTSFPFSRPGLESFFSIVAVTKHELYIFRHHGGSNASHMPRPSTCFWLASIFWIAQNTNTFWMMLDTVAASPFPFLFYMCLYINGDSSKSSLYNLPCWKKLTKTFL